MIQEFQEHLNSLKTISRPAIEPIKPRSGKSPFLKITFISDGEEREFTRLNKTSTNNYETRSLTPLPYEKEVKSKVKTTVAKYLQEMGFHIPDNEIGTMAYAQYQPEFHLIARVFISGLPGVPKDESHSFLIKLNRSDIKTRIDAGMSGIAPRDKPLPRHEQNRPSTDNQRPPTGDLIVDAIQAINDRAKNHDPKNIPKNIRAGASNQAAGANSPVAGAS